METNAARKITVVIRQKGPSPSVKNRGAEKLYKTSPQRILFKTVGRQKEYLFDRVFDPNTTQFTLYQFAITPLLKHILNGLDSLVFLYGQSGSGKSYSILGKYLASPFLFHTGSPGLLPRTIMHLLAYIKNAADLKSHLTISFVEVYNGKSKDLLANLYPCMSEKEKNELKSDQTVVTCEVVDYDEFLKILNIAQLNQEISNLNRTASEVSTICIVTLKQEIRKETIVQPNGSIVFVDLAASENLENFYEAQLGHNQMTEVKKSLLALGTVLEAFNTNMDAIPYSQSKLTSTLEKYFSSESKIAFIATIASDSPSHFLQSGYSLDFAEMIQMQHPAEVPQEEIFIDPIIDLRVLTMEMIRLRSKIAADIKLVLRNHEQTPESQCTDVITVQNNLEQFLRDCLEVNQRMHCKRLEAIARGNEEETVNINQNSTILGETFLGIVEWRKRLKYIAEFYVAQASKQSLEAPETSPLSIKDKRQESESTVIPESSSGAMMRWTDVPVPKASLSSMDDNQQNVRTMLKANRSSNTGTMSTANMPRIFQSSAQGKQENLRSIFKKPRPPSAATKSTENKNEDWMKRFTKIKSKIVADNFVLGHFLDNFIVYLLQTKKLNISDLEQFFQRFKEAKSGPWK